MTENQEICKLCGGQCCKTISGTYIPDDFESVTIETMMHLLHENKTSIDWWEGDLRENVSEEDEVDQTYFLRPRHVGAHIIDPAWTGICIFLTDTGCELEYKDRPFNCRDTIPIPAFECTGTKSKVDLIKKWIPYQNILTECCKRIGSE